MTTTRNYPGVYVEEIPSGVRTIVGVATSITAFIGRARQGPVDEPVRIQSFADYDRQFGGLWRDSPMSYAVQHFFLHGGRDAIVVRVAAAADPSVITLPASAGELTLESANDGSWGNGLRVSADNETADTTDANLFNLTVQLVDVGPEPTEEDVLAADATVLATEQFRNVSVDLSSPRHVTSVLAQGSVLVNVKGTASEARPDPTPDWVANDRNGDDGNDVDHNQIAHPDRQSERRGLWALDTTDLFNLLHIPPLSPDAEVHTDTLIAAAKYCKDNRAFLIIDPRSEWTSAAATEDEIDEFRSAFGDSIDHAAAYFPMLRMGDPLQDNRSADFAPGGAIAGIMARTDATRGVWKAPAGIEASFSGVRELTFKLDDPANGRLNPKGVNALRSFPAYGKVIWGSRTLAGDDRLGSEWKYIPVRRLALFLEESLYRGTQWAVFEPNDEPLWAELRLNIGAFMQNLFRQGAFQGQAAKDAYFVKVDKETTTQNDINLGIVNIVIGFAPLKPAEFVILKFQQMAGQIDT